MISRAIRFQIETFFFSFFFLFSFFLLFLSLNDLTFIDLRDPRIQCLPEGTAFVTPKSAF